MILLQFLVSVLIIVCCISLPMGTSYSSLHIRIVSSDVANSQSLSRGGGAVLCCCAIQLLVLVLLPAAKWRGDDFLPAVSRAFTLCGVTRVRTRDTSPCLQASNRSRRGSPGDKEMVSCGARDLLEDVDMSQWLLVTSLSWAGGCWLVVTLALAGCCCWPGLVLATTPPHQGSILASLRITPHHYSLTLTGS